MVHGVTGHRQPVTLDRVGEHDRWLIDREVAAAERVDQQTDVVAAEVRHERLQPVVVEPLGDPDHRRVGAVQELAPNVRPRQREQLLVRLVAQRVDVCLERIASRFRERGGQSGPVLGLGDVPARVGEEALQADRGDVGDHPVEALAVEVDHHREVAELLRRRVGDRFPHVALVELGVTDQRDEPRRGLRAEVRIGVPPRQRREERRDGAEADRSGREVRHVGILRP